MDQAHSIIKAAFRGAGSINPPTPADWQRTLTGIVMAAAQSEQARIDLVNLSGSPLQRPGALCHALVIHENYGAQDVAGPVSLYMAAYESGDVFLATTDQIVTPQSRSLRPVHETSCGAFETSRTNQMIAHWLELNFSKSALLAMFSIRPERVVALEQKAHIFA